MHNLKPVVWHEGMFLTPHHFQARDRSVDDNLDFRVSASNFENWGLSELSIDDAALKKGCVTLLRCAGIFHDGLAFNMPESDDPPDCRQIDAQCFPTTLKSMDVFLAIRANLSGGRNAWMPAEDQSTTATPPPARYLAVRQEFPDDVHYSTDSGSALQRPVHLGKRNFRLILGKESQEGYSTLLIARIVRDEERPYKLSATYAPPCIEITSSQECLMPLLKARLLKLATRSREINERRQEGAGIAGFANPEDFLLLQTINAYGARLQHLCNVRHGHPELSYALLLELAGSLCSFRGVDPMAPPTDGRKKGREGLPTYNHNDLGECFATLDELIESLLTFSSRAKYIEIKLDREGPFWFGSLADDRYFEKTQFYLSIRTESNAELLTQTPQVVKVASKEKVKFISNRALLGLDLSHQPVPPPTIPAKGGSQHFLLVPSSGKPFWDEIRSKNVRNIGIWIKTDVIKDPQVRLLIALESGSF